ncbi:8891_t:CDS:2 [Acaulospora morrowiae]|uniref:8891_t:CDS:1 n=1 Tax=Acaulospora morrowiae TaxID=94023 RepID=A0A9N9HPM8_9GLOM|nr:8891_t:CDS:2 [Acaulospora morrowiae]
MSFNIELQDSTFDPSELLSTLASEATEIIQSPEIVPEENSQCDLAKKVKSQVWNYFTTPAVSSDGKTRKTKCKLPGCGKEYKYSGSPSNLRYHLRNGHDIIVNANSKRLAQSHTISHKRSKKTSPSRKNDFSLTVDSDFYRLIKSKNSQYHTSEFIDSQIIHFYDQLFPKLKNILRDAESVALAIESIKIDSCYYTKITCHWLSDDFQLCEIFLDIIPIPKHIGKDDIFKSIKGVLNVWEINDKVISITREKYFSKDHISDAINNFEDVIHLHCNYLIKLLLATIFDRELEFLDESHKKLLEKEMDYIMDEAKKIGINAKNSKKLMTYLIRHEQEFLKEALRGNKNHNIEDLLKYINDKLIFIFYVLEYIVILEAPIRQWITVLINSPETTSKGNWINSLMPDTTVIRFFNNLNLCFTFLRNAMRKLDDAKNTFYTLAIEFLRLGEYIWEYDQKFEERIKQNQLVIDEILTKLFIDDMYSFLRICFDYIHCKIAFFDPYTKNALKDKNEMDKLRQDIESEYLELCARTQNTSSNSGLVMSSKHFRNLGDYEFERYNILSLHSQNERINPIEWWRIHKDEFPVMAKLAQKYLAIPEICCSFEGSHKTRYKKLKALFDDFPNFDIVRRYEFLEHNKDYLCYVIEI